MKSTKTKVDKETKQKIADILHKQMHESTIPKELMVMYMMANATELISQNVNGRIVAMYERNGLHPRENYLLKGLNEYCKLIKAATFQFFQRVEPQIMDATFFATDNDGDDTRMRAARYDQFTQDSATLVRLVLLFIDRCSKSETAYGKVFETLRKLPSMGIFEDRDFTRFKTKL